jgi:dihydropteroate synthase
MAVRRVRARPAGRGHPRSRRRVDAAGSRARAADIELRRVLPVLQRLHATRSSRSADQHRHAPRRCRARCDGAGAAIINDISGLADPAMAAVAARDRRRPGARAPSRRTGDHAAWHSFTDLLAEVAAELVQAVERALRAGVPGRPHRRRSGHRLRQDRRAERRARRRGSRPGPCDRLSGARSAPVARLSSARSPGGPVGERMIASVAAAVIAVERGASIVRVHDVGPRRRRCGSRGRASRLRGRSRRGEAHP